MKKNKGFTLVELLAVIAILAILMLLIMPNTLKLFQKGKKDAFKVQVQNIVKIAESQKQSDTMAGINLAVYCDKISETCPKLDITDSDLKYAVTFGADGLATSVAVENTNYCYVNSSDVTDIDTDDFIEGSHLSCEGVTCTCTSSSTSSEQVTNGYVYWSVNEGGDGREYDSESKPSNAKSTYTSFAQPAFLIRTKVTNGNVEGHEACIYDNNKLACIEPNYWVDGDSDGSLTTSKLSNYFTGIYGSSAYCDSNYTNVYMSYCSTANSAYLFSYTFGTSSDYNGGYCQVMKSGIARCFGDTPMG